MSNWFAGDLLGHYWYYKKTTNGYQGYIYKCGESTWNVSMMDNHKYGFTSCRSAAEHIISLVANHNE